MKGGLSVMDTEDRGLESRALELAVDDGNHTVRQARVWGLGRHCEHEGSSYPLSNGADACRLRDRAHRRRVRRGLEPASLDPDHAHARRQLAASDSDQPAIGDWSEKERTAKRAKDAKNAKRYF
jgi:hypothetical protein